ncbi:TonB family protein [Hymenobacter actinosclerus]|uniref:TonB family C-terminal domain-containing protein n=1 Tax=Hymenobacter actinosclerus TaxID=82805 RepID=A0A1H9YVG3_9BACT|nr:TonB family protein [Hymenobacter actinosclerus]SES72664.1 TonB family C-terminal domain-containing protein [Hymenobacter actinosclerus]
MLRPDDFTPDSPSRHLPTELLRRYVAGELSALQEHGVEAHTLECEQCAEVLEGLEMQPAPVTDTSLTELRQRLRTRVAELADEAPAGAVVRPLWWRSMAAAAMLLLTLGAVAWLVLRPSNRPEIAARTSQTAENTRRISTTPLLAAESAQEMAAAPEPEVALVLPPAQPIPPAAQGATGKVSATRPVVQANSTDVAYAPVAAEEASVDGVASKASADAASPASYATTSAPPAATEPMATRRRTAEQKETARSYRAATTQPSVAGAGRTVQGRIVDTAGQPVPGATISIPGASNGVSTNSEGYFSLKPGINTSQFSVSAIGYSTQTRFLRPTDSTFTLALVPDHKQLSEVVVVRREAPPSLPSIGPLPAGGYPAFRQYLLDSLDYPEKARERSQQGTVRLQFVVQADGRLSDIKVVRRLTPECDEEAIRLLKDGPAWFPGVQNNRRMARKVELNVPFSLEKK